VSRGTGMSRETRAMVASARDGDREAFNGLVERYEKGVCAMVYALTADWHMSQDIAQDAFLIALRRVSSIRDPGSFPTWLFRIAHRHAINCMRERDRRSRVLHEAAVNRHSAREIREGCAVFDPGQVERGEHRDAVREALRALKADWAAAISLRYYEGLTCREIGEVLGIDVRNVRVRLHRGRKALRKRLVKAVSGRGVGKNEVRGRRTPSG